MKAIVIDDDPLIVSLMNMILNKRGYKVESYTDPSLCPLYQGKARRPGISSWIPDIIISDYEMPYVNGLEFLEALNQKGYPCRRMALMSGSSVPEKVVNRLDSFDVKFITKPFRLGDIMDWLNEVEANPVPVPVD